MAFGGTSSMWSARYRVSDLAAAPGAAGIPDWVELGNFHVPHQEQTNWCWAATSLGVSAFYGPYGWTQCMIANGCLARTDCCGGGAGGPCNVYGYLNQALTLVGNFNRMSGVASFDAVHGEMVAKRPLGVRVAWQGGGAHFLAIGGAGIPMVDFHVVHVEDPWYGPSNMLYDDLVQGYKQRGRWTSTYWTKPHL